MNILHTADWHLGQLFYEYDRTYEHQQFLDWLVDTVRDAEVDVLLISGDVFDLSNPSAVSVKQFYTFLNQATKARPGLQIVITAGNHDSASRLESPKPLLESSSVHIVGVVEKDAEGSIDYDKLIVPILKNGQVAAWCLAIPFLRMGDYPTVKEAENPYAAGVAQLYADVYQVAKSRQQPGQAIIAMGHLHARGAEVSSLDNFERPIMGGVECIAVSAFPEDLAYIALGHIHKAQRLGSKEHIRYSGSPIPMSFSELHYRHQVILFTIEHGLMSQLTTIEVPVTVPLLKVPTIHSSLDEVLFALQQLPEAQGNDPATAPYLQVSVLLDAPEPGLRYQVEQALKGKYVRLARIDTRYPEKTTSVPHAVKMSTDEFRRLQPSAVFSDVYKNKYGSEVPEELMALFQEIMGSVQQEEDTA